MLELKRLRKDIEGKLGYVSTVIDNISLTVRDHEFSALLAPEFSGKSTLLKLIAGIYKKTDGEIIFSGHKEPGKSTAAYIPTEPSSFPWMNVEDNVKFFIRNSGIPGINETEKVKEVLKLTGLTGFERHQPDNRSLGFRFRVALARALAVNPLILLIDEPFNKMDDRTRYEIYEILKRVFSRSELSILLATSCLDEAYLLADKVYIMSGRPAHLLDEMRPEPSEEKHLRKTESSSFHDFKSQVEKIYAGTQIRTILSE